jgi:hypothetical protein
MVSGGWAENDQYEKGEIEMKMFHVQVLRQGAGRASKVLNAASGEVNHPQATLELFGVEVMGNVDTESKYLIKGYFSETRRGGYAWFEADFDVQHGREASFYNLRAVSDPVKWTRAKVNRNLTVISRRDRRVKIGTMRNASDENIDALIADLTSPL